MTNQLPSNPSLVQLKKQSKDLLKAHKTGDAACCAILRLHHRFRDRTDVEILTSTVGLREIQHALALDYGFKGWAELKKIVLSKAGDHSMRHILCGDICGQALKDSKVPGDVFVWPEIFLKGPTPGDVSDDEFSLIRAGVLASCFLNTSVEDMRRSAANKYARFDSARDYKEVVLWFDACLFDQTHMIHHIDRLSRLKPPHQTLSLICIGEFPGFDSFRGLGQLRPGQMESLLDTRHEITSQEIELARRAWKAFRSSDPRDIEEVVAGDCSALPYLRAALIRFLEQYPSVRNGLDKLQSEILVAVSAGATKLGPVFSRVLEIEEVPYMGRETVWEDIDDLANANGPALAIEGPKKLTEISKVDSETVSETDLKKWTIGLTDFGQKLLAGNADFIAANGIDRWLGGVHLQGDEAQWRWDESAKRLVGSDAVAQRTTVA